VRGRRTKQMSHQNMCPSFSLFSCGRFQYLCLPKGPQRDAVVPLSLSKDPAQSLAVHDRIYSWHVLLLPLFWLHFGLVKRGRVRLRMVDHKNTLGMFGWFQLQPYLASLRQASLALLVAASQLCLLASTWKNSLAHTTWQPRKKSKTMVFVCYLSRQGDT
jgi:hypothetical protein